MSTGLTCQAPSRVRGPRLALPVVGGCLPFLPTPFLAASLPGASPRVPRGVSSPSLTGSSPFSPSSGATWDLQPEKLDFTQFHRKLRHTPKQSLPHIDREG